MITDEGLNDMKEQDKQSINNEQAQSETSPDALVHRASIGYGSDQLQFWSEPYDLKIVRRMYVSYGLSKFSDQQIIDALNLCRGKYQFWCGHPTVRHHNIIEEPCDDWFLSRIYDELVHPTLCSVEA